MGLLEDVDSVRARLAVVKGAEANVDEAKKLSELRMQLHAKNEELGQAADKVSLLASNGIRLTGIDVRPALARVTSVTDKFRDSSVSSTLKTGSRWTQLIDSLESASDAVRLQLESGWRTYVASLFSGSPPDQMSSKIPITPDNQRALERYRRLYGQFAGLRKAVPATLRELQLLQECSKELGEIKFELRDAPEEVKAFINAAATSGGFPLSAMNASVIDWLRQNALIGDYIVRQRIQ